MRLLMQLIKIIAAMLGFREKGKPEEAIRLADEAYKDMFDLPVSELADMPLERFLEMARKENYTATILEKLAELVYETGKAFDAKGDNDTAMKFYQKSLLLYSLLNEKDKTFSFEREKVVSELKQLTNI